MRRQKRLSIVAVLCVLLVAAPAPLAAAGLCLAGYLLPLHSPETRTDAIVVLGGFGVPRAELAAQMFAAHRAPLVIVTGAGDCEAMQQTLVAKGVPPAAIETDCTARSTFDNATATAKLLQGRSLACATIVTHWFHIRRAVATFSAVMPDTRFFAESVEPDATPRWRLGWVSEPTAVLSEYLKIAWYAVAHGVLAPLGPEQKPGDCA